MGKDVIEALAGQSPTASEAVLSRLLAQDAQGARIEAVGREWPLDLLSEIEDLLAHARREDEPMPPDAEPEDFLEYARGTDDSARKGLVALATLEMLINRVGSLSQCVAVAQWFVNKLRGVPLVPLEMPVSDFPAHAGAHPEAQYLLRWRAQVWVSSAEAVYAGRVMGGRPGEHVSVGELSQVWALVAQ